LTRSKKTSPERERGERHPALALGAGDQERKGTGMSSSEQPETPPPAAEKPRRERPDFKAGRPQPMRPDEGFSKGPNLRDLDAEIEQELKETLGGLSEKEIFGEPARGRKPEGGPAGGRKLARVIRVHGADVFLDVPGGRSGGVLPMLQFPDGPPAVGDEVEVHIEGYDAANGLLILSRKGAAVQADWASVATGMIVEARVTETNKGGLSVDVNGIRGFMPISQIDLYRIEDANQFVNQRLLCLVVSRRALLEKEREENREKLWQELAEGQVRSGIVRNVLDFGAFVDLGGVDGLIPISEMSWQRVNDPTTLVKPGETVKVVVLRIDQEKRKVALGLKQLTASPWDGIETRYTESTVVKGKVTRLAEFGAFVELEPAVEGLIHISELAPQRVHRVGDIVKVGQDVQVMILRIDKEQRRISLSLKAALALTAAPAEEEEEDEEPVEVKPPRPRTTPLRGGLGDQ
jgi:ribosomal protein S1